MERLLNLMFIKILLLETKRTNRPDLLGDVPRLGGR